MWISDCFKFLCNRGHQGHESGGSTENKKLRYRQIPEIAPGEASLLHVGRRGHQESHIRRKEEDQED